MGAAPEATSEVDRWDDISRTVRAMTKLKVVLISTYELGRQPFGLTSPAAWLRKAGASVTCLDLAVQRLDVDAVKAADMVAFYVPMHTATRIAATVAHRVKKINRRAHLCFYGLYAPVNEGFLRGLGADTILGGEFEEGLVTLVQRLTGGLGAWTSQSEPVVSLIRQTFLVPDRSGLPGLQRYAHLKLPDGSSKVVGYTEASRGCKHLCRHCPIVPVYGGRFFIVQPDVVLADIERQIAVGARHITFGDPDFFNGPTHAIRLVETLHRRFPDLTYDVTIKVEHLLRHATKLPILRDTGCLFVTSAVEAVDNRILEAFDKRHTRDDFIRVVALFRDSGLNLNPTFVAFNPWISLDGYRDLLNMIRELDLVGNVSPIQYAIRLLIPAGSRLMELPAVRELVGEFDQVALVYPWDHPDPRVDRLHADVLKVVSGNQPSQEDRLGIFTRIWALVASANGKNGTQRRKPATASGRHWQPIPHLSEPWYC
jgi:radical SAM superfamily enzyme YgiQ (UPF0313 family)